jgi:adenylate cyclase 9
MASHVDDDDDCTADETVALKSKDCSSAITDQHKDALATVEIGMVEISPFQQPSDGSRKSPTSGDPASAQAQSATTGAAVASGTTGGACGTSKSSPRIPILFERAADSWWNPQFDSDPLEKQLIASSFPQTRRRFRFALGYVMLICAAWCVFFAVAAERRSSHWSAFVVGTAILLAVCAAAFALTFTNTYRRIVLPVSLVVTGAMCIGDLMTFVFGRQSEMSAVGTFAWSVEIVLLMYTLIPMPLYMCTIAGVCYSIGFELLAAFLGEMQSPRYVVARVLLHVSIHFIGIHVFIMSQVRQRTTFLKVGQSLILRRALQTEKQIKHNMIHSLMPPKVAEEVMKSRETATGDDELQDLLAPNGRAGGGGRSRVNGTGAAPIPGASVPFRTFHMDKMDNVSILFADIVGFTKMSSNKSAEHLVRLLNDLFGRFDDVCRRNNCEKISTLGDCYYCVSGCPEPRPDHAQCCVEMGLAMCVAIQEFDKVHNEEVNMRVGVHTGAVLCGIVGTRRFKFDVWSHDVTLANMMESEGQPGRVHISNKTYQFISDKYEVEPGEDVQGKYVQGRVNC